MIKDQKMNKKIAGVYLLDGVMDGAQIAVSKAPSKFKLRMIKFVLGWGFAPVEELAKWTKNKK